jgi:hypothetical protein
MLAYLVAPSLATARSACLSKEVVALQHDKDSGLRLNISRKRGPPVTISRSRAQKHTVLASGGLVVEFAAEIFRVISIQPNLDRTMTNSLASNLRCARLFARPSTIPPHSDRAPTETSRIRCSGEVEAHALRISSLVAGNRALLIHLWSLQLPT